MIMIIIIKMIITITIIIIITIIITITIIIMIMMIIIYLSIYMQGCFPLKGVSQDKVRTHTHTHGHIHSHSFQLVPRPQEERESTVHQSLLVTSISQPQQSTKVYSATSYLNHALYLLAPDMIQGSHQNS